jgi:hypothetical protein
VDTRANPEEIDFEGLSGRVNVRQEQLRWMPGLGKQLNLAVAIEDPRPDVTGGSGVSEVPDLVARVRRTVGRRHVQTSLLLRQIQAQSDADPNNTEEDLGWGLSISGKVKVLKWNERDHLLFQLNAGDGIGRYINDLESEGGQDAVFDPESGDLETLEAFGGYVAFNHWWSESMRSTLVYSETHVDNLDFQPDDAYRRTQRVTVNLLISPVPRFSLGAEILWGRRHNKDGASGIARQIQFAWIYRF